MLAYLAITGQPYEYEYVISVHETLEGAQAASLADLLEESPNREPMRWEQDGTPSATSIATWNALWGDPPTATKYFVYYEIQQHEVKP